MGALTSSHGHLIGAAGVMLLACNAILGNEEGQLAERDADATSGTERAQSPNDPEPTNAPHDEAPDASSPSSDAGVAHNAPAQTCGAGLKACGRDCVRAADPAFGCSNPNCLPCKIPHAVAACGVRGCVVGACTAGWADCDGKPDNGCEANLASPATCGACGARCQAPHNATSTCSAGLCVVACAPGFGDCDGKPDNGCEANLTHDKKNCGACGLQCIFGHCESGVCALGGGKGED